MQFQVLKRTPASAPQTSVVKFISPTGLTDIEGRWHWWLELAKVGLFVKSMYANTEYAQYGNCEAGPGSKGQAVVKTNGLGTILWMATGRVYSSNATAQLQQLLEIVFPPFDTTRSVCKGPQAVLDFSIEAVKPQVSLRPAVKTKMSLRPVAKPQVSLLPAVKPQVSLSPHR